MSWTDKGAVKVIKFLRDKYKITTLVETGAFKGINARLHSKNFNLVITCENNHAYYEEAKENLKYDKNKPIKYQKVILVNEDSPEFLKKLSLGKYIFYLDAHFYNPDVLEEDRFVVKKELENMKKFKDSVIIIHDFDNGMGHIIYDGISLNMDLLKSRLLKINKDLFFYTNTLEGCEPVKPIADDIRDAGLIVDFDTLDCINYAWLAPKLTYRGYLYCLPTKLNENELNQLGLRKWN